MARKEQEVRVQDDLRHLSNSLHGNDLKPEVMFAKGRNIRSCTPSFEIAEHGVRERLKRVQPPEEE